MSKDKQTEIHELAKQMSEAISTEVEQKYIMEEAKLEAVLRANGWVKAEEIFAEIEKSIATIKYTVDSPRYTHIPIETMVEVCNWILQDCIPKRLAELKKKYESEKD